MKRKKVFLLSGPPASGKSTYVRSHLLPGGEWISRDNVRFALVGENEEYFSREDEVFETFINYINQTLENPEVHTIYIDATHLNLRSRQKTLRRINMKNIEELNCVCFTTPLKVCLERNSKREGREKVPEDAIKRMYFSYLIPNQNLEPFDSVILVDEFGRTI